MYERSRKIRKLEINWSWFLYARKIAFLRMLFRSVVRILAAVCFEMAHACNVVSGAKTSVIYTFVGFTILPDWSSTKGVIMVEFLCTPYLRV